MFYLRTQRSGDISRGQPSSRSRLHRLRGQQDEALYTISRGRHHPWVRRSAYQGCPDSLVLKKRETESPRNGSSLPVLHLSSDNRLSLQPPVWLQYYGVRTSQLRTNERSSEEAVKDHEKKNQRSIFVTRWRAAPHPGPSGRHLCDLSFLEGFQGRTGRKASRPISSSHPDPDPDLDPGWRRSTAIRGFENGDSKKDRETGWKRKTKKCICDDGMLTQYNHRQRLKCPQPSWQVLRQWVGTCLRSGPRPLLGLLTAVPASDQ